jgi:hypothetical protein
MNAVDGDLRCSGPGASKYVLASAACALLAAACAGPETSYQAAAIEASQSGDQEKAISLARKEVARFSTEEQCSRTTNYNCGTLALAYGGLAEYQILNGELTAGESSFRWAKEALRRTNPVNKASATGVVYRDVSEAFWKSGDRARAIAVFKEGRAAGGDSYLYMSSAAGVADKEPAAISP